MQSRPQQRLFYAAGLLASLTGQAATAMAVESAGLFAATSVLTALGYIVSRQLKMRGRSLRVVEGIVIAICFATYARLFATGETTPLFSPGKALFHKELSLAVMLVWAEVVRSYSLISDEALLFTTVPSLALIGVVATTGSEQSLIFFAIWLFASVLLFIESGRNRVTRPSGAHAVRTFTLSGALGVACLVVGLLASPIIHRGSIWLFVTFAPDIYSSRHAIDTSAGEPEVNVLEISDGPVRLSSREEMIVESPEPAYWRTRVWDVYLGRDWKCSKALEESRPGYMERAAWFGAEASRGDAQVFYAPDPGFEAAETKTIRQRFVASSAAFRGYLPMAGEAVEIAVKTPALRRDAFNCWRLAPSRLPRPDSYEVISRVPNASADQLREANGEIPEKISSHYTRVPLDASEVVKIARKVTDRYDNSYDKLLAIQRYLASHCSYDLKTPPLPQQERDVVVYFLTRSKRGYCDVFSTAMAVMARSVGIPARIATGYATGDFDQERGCYVVREKDRHSWPEIYFPEYGWIPFEATPGTEIPEANFMVSLAAELRLMIEQNRSLMMYVAVALLMILVTRVLFPNDERTEKLAVAKDPQMRRVLRAWKSLQRILSRRLRIEVRKSTTPMEMAESASEALPEQATGAREAINTTCALLTEILYAPDARHTARIADLEAAIAMVKIETGAKLRQLIDEIIATEDGSESV